MVLFFNVQEANNFVFANRLGGKNPLCGKRDVIFSYIYTNTISTCILFSTFRLILSAFN